MYVCMCIVLLAVFCFVVLRSHPRSAPLSTLRSLSTLLSTSGACLREASSSPGWCPCVPTQHRDENSPLSASGMESSNQRRSGAMELLNLWQFTAVFRFLKLFRRPLGLTHKWTVEVYTEKRVCQYVHVCMSMSVCKCVLHVLWYVGEDSRVYKAWY